MGLVLFSCLFASPTFCFSISFKRTIKLFSDLFNFNFYSLSLIFHYFVFLFPFLLI